MLLFRLFFPYKMPKTCLFVHGLQLRGYISECSRLFNVVVEYASAVFLRRLMGELETLS